MKRVKNYLRWINLFLVIITLLAYLAPFVSPSSFWPLAFMGLVFPWLLLLHLLFLVFWLALKKRYFIFSLLTIIAGWGYVRSFVGFNVHALHETPKGAVKIMSFNAHGIVPRSRLNQQSEKAYAEFAELIARENAHIYCFQEVPNLKNAVRQGESLIHPPMSSEYRIVQEHGSLGILTHLPVLDYFYHYFDHRTNGYIWADVQWADGKVFRVLNVHLQSNGITTMTQEVTTKRNLQDKKTWLSIRRILGNYKRAVQKRASQAETIAEVIRQSPHPVVVCGDFNDVPLSYTYRVIAEGLQDAFKKKGGGLATTYSGHLPALRIDYIFVAPSFHIHSFYTGPRNFSDHKPVCTIIETTNK